MHKSFSRPLPWQSPSQDLRISQPAASACSTKSSMASTEMIKPQKPHKHSHQTEPQRAARPLPAPPPFLRNQAHAIQSSCGTRSWTALPRNAKLKHLPKSTSPAPSGSQKPPDRLRNNFLSPRPSKRWRRPPKISSPAHPLSVSSGHFSSDSTTSQHLLPAYLNTSPQLCRPCSPWRGPMVQFRRLLDQRYRRLPTRVGKRAL